MARIRLSLLPALALAVAMVSGLVPQARSASPTRTITDQSDRQVAVPAMPARIADLWYAHNELLIMLGATDRIAVTVVHPSTAPWMYRVAPALGRATQLASTTPNAEALLAAGIDLAFTAPSLTAADAIARVGIPTVAVTFTDAASLTRCLDLTADILDTDQARAVAARYDAELGQTERSIHAMTDPLLVSARPRVLHLLSLSPLKVDGDHTIIDDWIRTAGGRNAATGLSGNMQPVSVEQIVAWNPDIIILGGTTGQTFDSVRHDPLWQSVKAVHDGRLYRNPVGVFAWDRYGTEYLLQLLWTAKLLHPDLLRDVDMIARTQHFYRTYFSYTLSPDEAQRILDARPPA